MKPLISTLLAGGICLAALAGCSALPEKLSTVSLPFFSSQPAAEATPTPTPTPTPEPEPGLLRVSLPEGDDDLHELFDAYSQEQNVTVEYVSAAEADLCVYLPGESTVALAQDDSSLHDALYTMLETEPDADSLPFGYTGYGWLVNRSILSALLGDYGWNDLQLCTLDELEDFCDALTQWLEEPQEATITLNGMEHTLPAEFPEGCEKLMAVFMPCSASSNASRVLNYAEGSEEKAAELYRLLTLESTYAYSLPAEEAAEGEEVQEPEELTEEQAEDNFAAGCALFYRADTLTGETLAERGMMLSLWAPPIEREAPEEGEEDEATAGLPLAGVYRRLGITASGDNRQASAFVYWLYTGYQGQHMLTDVYGLAQPGLRIPSSEPSADLARHVEDGRYLDDTDYLSADRTQAADQVLQNADLSGSGESAFVEAVTALFR